MLGFGEIFAKNVLMDWIGWRPRASVAGNVGAGNAGVGQPGVQKRNYSSQANRR
jgi:hypothetical protein